MNRKETGMLFIAEIGLNHNGNFGLIHELVRQAKKANADIAKFQLGWRCKEGEMNHITPDILKTIVQICAYYDIEPMFSIINEDAYELVKPYNFNRFKIASRTVIDKPELVEKVLDFGKETIISLGFWKGEELPFNPSNKIKYLFCKSLYPTAPWEITDLPKNFSTSPYAGYSDHTVGIEVALLAITRGAKIIEKHFTLDKSDTTIRDHALSATPAEFSRLVEHGRYMEKLISIGV